MSKLLNSMAVASRSGSDAQAILEAYVSTAPEMAMSYSHQQQPALSKAPKGTGAGDKFMDPMS